MVLKKYFGIRSEYGEKSHPPEWTHDMNYKPILTRKTGVIHFGVLEKKHMIKTVSEFMDELKEGDKIILECTCIREE